MRLWTGCGWRMTTTRGARVPGRTAQPGAAIARIGAALLIAVLAVAAWGVPAAAAQPAQPPVNEFVPIDELPPEDRLPAAPFLIAAYSIVWVLAFGYFWSLARRFAAVERDLAGLTRRAGDRADPE